jgi:hypothetical protein
MVKHKSTTAILEKFLLVNAGSGKFYFINSQTQEKSSEFSDKKNGLKILDSWFKEEKINAEEELDLITLMYEKNEMPFLFFSSDKRKRKNFSEKNLILHQMFITRIIQLKSKIKGFEELGASL